MRITQRFLIIIAIIGISIALTLLLLKHSKEQKKEPGVVSSNNLVSLCVQND